MGGALQGKSGDGTAPLIRVAAVGDLHFGLDSAGSYKPLVEALPGCADVLLVAGDLSQHGAPEEFRVLAEELAGLRVPVVTVFGNHDYHLHAEDENRRILEEAGVVVLEGESYVLDLPAGRLGVAGIKGFCGGYAGACGAEFGEPEMKDFIGKTKRDADALAVALDSIAACDVRVAMTHYSPIKGTLVGEKLEIYPFLGSYLLGEVIDDAKVDLAVHGHAHKGTERGVTPGGIAVRNVAMPVIRTGYHVFTFGPEAEARVEHASAAR
jgi:Icc-related predicted phosphoesterase